MARNPMQKKAQISFLTGILITLLITGIIIAVLILQLTKMTNQQNAEKAKLRNVYALSKDINSGDTVSEDALTTMVINADAIPSNAITGATLSEMTATFDNDGNLVKKVDVIAKINLKKGTILTSDMIAQVGEMASDIRKVEYNMIVLPSQLENNKYVDIRLTLPSGQDLIVLSHKKIEIANIDGVDSLNTIWMNLSEDEILTLSCAIVESYKIEGSKLYAAEYIDPGLQTAAIPTYLPDDTTINLINRDPNCVEEAKQAIFKRNNDQNQKAAVRNPVNSGLNENADQATDNVVSGIEKEIQKTQEERQKYLESLGGSY